MKSYLKVKNELRRIAEELDEEEKEKKKERSDGTSELNFDDDKTANWDDFNEDIDHEI